MSEVGDALPLSDAARLWFSVGLAAAFVISMGFIFALLKYGEIDLGYLGLIFMLTVIFYLIAFSFLIAASTPGISIKVAVAFIDAFVLIGSKLLGPSFLDYIVDDGTQIPLSRRGLSSGSREKNEARSL